jgi:hypothetical protein
VEEGTVKNMRKKKEHKDSEDAATPLLRGLSHNDAELAGMFAGAVSNWEPDPPIGSPAWAVQEEVIDRYGSRDAYNFHLESLSPVSLEGHVDNLKGHAFERWLEHHGEMIAHESPNFPGSDGVDPDTRGLVEAKAGSAEYIREQRGEYSDQIEMHTSVEGQDVPGVTAHEVSESEFAVELGEFNNNGMLAELMGSSVAFGAILTGRDALNKVCSGEIRVKDVPHTLVADAMGRSVRILLIGNAVASGSPVFVATGTGWLAYRNRHVLARLTGFIRSAASHPMTEQSAEVVRNTGWRATQWACTALYSGATHPMTRKLARGATRTATKAAGWSLKAAIKTIGHGITGLIRLAARRTG